MITELAIPATTHWHIVATDLIIAVTIHFIFFPEVAIPATAHQHIITE